MTCSAEGTRLAAVGTNTAIKLSNNGGLTVRARKTARDWMGITSSADGSRLAAVDIGLGVGQNGGYIYVSSDS